MVEWRPRSAAFTTVFPIRLSAAVRRSPATVWCYSYDFLSYKKLKSHQGKFVDVNVTFTWPGYCFTACVAIKPLICRKSGRRRRA
jgi:hypothetical protein